MCCVIIHQTMIYVKESLSSRLCSKVSPSSLVAYHELIDFLPILMKNSEKLKERLTGGGVIC